VKHAMNARSPGSRLGRAFQFLPLFPCRRCLGNLETTSAASATYRVGRLGEVPVQYRHDAIAIRHRQCTARAEVDRDVDDQERRAPTVGPSTHL
jgi:hypothetical protein